MHLTLNRIYVQYFSPFLSWFDKYNRCLSQEKSSSNVFFLQNLIKYEMSIIPRFPGDIVFSVRFIHIALQENWLLLLKHTLL